MGCQGWDVRGGGEEYVTDPTSYLVFHSTFYHGLRSPCSFVVFVKVFEEKKRKKSLDE